MVTVSSLPIRTQAFGIAVVAVAAWAPRSGSVTPRTSAPDAAAPAFRNSRREAAGGSMSRPLSGRAVHGGAYARIGTAAADVAGHGVGGVRIRGLWLPGQERAGAHDLAGLAVAALRHVQLRPGRLGLPSGGCSRNG